MVVKDNCTEALPALASCKAQLMPCVFLHEVHGFAVFFFERNLKRDLSTLPGALCELKPVGRDQGGCWARQSDFKDSKATVQSMAEQKNKDLRQKATSKST